MNKWIRKSFFVSILGLAFLVPASAQAPLRIAAAADLELARRFDTIATTAYVGVRDTRTARACRWTCPELHWLEAWSDALALDGTAAIAQPLVRPLVDGRSAGQVIAAMAGQHDASSRDLVQAYWRAHATEDFDLFWRQSLVHGVVPTGAAPPVEVGVDESGEPAASARPASIRRLG